MIWLKEKNILVVSPKSLKYLFYTFNVSDARDQG